MRAIAFLQKCFYKWQPRKCLSLDMANLIIFYIKNHKILVFFIHFLGEKKNRSKKKKLSFGLVIIHKSTWPNLIIG